MRHSRRSAVLAVAFLSGCPALYAAPVTINGATFDAPSTCQAATGALVCKVDGQQLELWVKRKSLSPDVLPTDTFVRKMAHFHNVHDAAVASIMRATSNDKAAPFSNYGPYSALGSAMTGNAGVSAPTVRFASVLHEEDIWEFLEVVATRTPSVESLSADLQRTLTLPTTPQTASAPIAATPAVAATPVAAGPAATPPPEPPKVEGSPLVATYSSALLSLEHPGYLRAEVLEDTAESLRVSFKHKTRPNAGPNLVINLLALKDKQQTAAAVVNQRRATVLETMTGQTASVDINKLGPLNGAGFALVGVPDPKKGLSGVESFETTFASEVNGRLLEVRLTAEQQYSSDARVVWAMLAQSLKLGN